MHELGRGGIATCDASAWPLSWTFRDRNSGPARATPICSCTTAFSFTDPMSIISVQQRPRKNRKEPRQNREPRERTGAGDKKEPGLPVVNRTVALEGAGTGSSRNMRTLWRQAAHCRSPLRGRPHIVDLPCAAGRT